MKLHYTLKEMGLKQSEHEHAIYRHITSDAILLIGVYLDDGSKGAIESFKDEIKTKFQMRPWIVVVVLSWN
jgi:hypothetical protein